MDTWRQLKGNPALLEKARQWGWNPQAIRFWEQAMTWDEEAFRTEIRKRVQLDRPHDQPAFWEDERFNNPSQPVVGVTWFEARAYCRWLDAQWRAVGARIASPLSEGYGVQLPSEAEWEYAARGRWGRRFPWGGRGDPGRANTLEGHVLRPTPVGSYPEGTTSQGIHEMSGNVWEWTRSLYKPYPYRAEDGRENPEAKGPLVVRGGAWGNRQGDARCAARVRYLPVGGYNFRGFRVVVSLVNSGF
jgi:formylglycine-generating enzyme required for sulfatase activity